jgi:CRISPR/Cas system CMR subunit Cmr4 (Cas7 group RAMP superfamily)
VSVALDLALPESRGVVDRWIIEGNLAVTSPALLRGAWDPDTDVPLALHPTDGRPFLPGDGLAGAFRSFLHDFEFGYFSDVVSSRTSLAAILLGGEQGDDEGEQSALIVDDALSVTTSHQSERRDWVRIAPDSGTAEDKLKFDGEALAAGHVFRLRLELTITRETSPRAKPALGLLLRALESGEIRVGGGRSRGFGRTTLEKDWKAGTFDLRRPTKLRAWLLLDPRDPLPDSDSDRQRVYTEAIEPSRAMDPEDRRDRLHLRAWFGLEDSLLVRSTHPTGTQAPDADVGPTRSWRNGTATEVIPGTSIAGALRARAAQIALSHGLVGIVEELFGPPPGSKALSQSRLEVEESVVPVGPLSAAVRQVQAQTAIDAWTGGTLDGALRFEEALYSNDKWVPDTAHQAIQLDIIVRAPSKPGAGLLLFLLKDLWTGDIAVGAGQGMGRGRLAGLEASFRDWSRGKWNQSFTIRAAENGSLQGHLQEFETKAEAFACLLPA